MGILKKAEAVRAQAAGRNVACLNCVNDRFFPRFVPLNTIRQELRDSSLFDDIATALICGRCGFVMEFMPQHLALEKQGRTTA